VLKRNNDMREIKKMYMKEDKSGYSFPVFIMEDGTQYIPRQTPTGHCWMLDWVINDEIN
jgi:hypothetical protein